MNKKLLLILCVLVLVVLMGCDYIEQFREEPQFEYDILVKNLEKNNCSKVSPYFYDCRLDTCNPLDDYGTNYTCSIGFVGQKKLYWIQEGYNEYTDLTIRFIGFVVGEITEIGEMYEIGKCPYKLKNITINGKEVEVCNE